MTDTGHLDDFCQAVVHVGNAMLTCDLYLNHDGRHGGVYPGWVDDQHATLTQRSVDVAVSWGDA